MPAQGVDPSIPCLGVRPEPVVDGLERLRVEVVEPLAADPPDPDESGVAHQVEMLRHGLAGDRQVARQLGDRQRMARAQSLEEDPAGRIGDGGQDGIHGTNMQPPSCICQVMRARRGPTGRPSARYDAPVRLTAWEEDRLLIFSAAELARRRLARGVALSQPEVVALICDAMLEAARDGASYAEVERAGRAAVRPDQVIPGVAQLVDEVRLEVLMGDGTRLVVIRDPLAGGDEPVDGPGAVRPGTSARAAATGWAPPERERRELEVRSTSRRVIRVSSHFPFHRVNRRLEFDREAARGFRLDVRAGDTLRWSPGEAKRVRLVRYAADPGGTP